MQDISDRFYRTLYASLHDPRLGPSSKQALYLNLLFKAIKQDKQLPRVMAFVKRLMQVMLGLDVVFILGSLFIVGEVSLVKVRKVSGTRLTGTCYSSCLLRKACMRC